MFILYDIIFILFGFVYFPYLLVRRKYHRGFLMRFGLWDEAVVSLLRNKSNIWIHAVSVGEVMAVVDLIQKLKKKFPSDHIVCSTVTQTGYQLAHERLKNEATILYAPLDLSAIVRKYIRLIRPKIYIAAETEIWPNLYTALHAQGVPIVQVNGRLSEKSFSGYKKVLFLTKKILRCVSVFCMQSKEDVTRILALGAKPSSVHCVGNLKFDIAVPSQERSLKDFGFSDDVRLVVAGSTHPGEEEMLLDIYTKLSKDFSQLRLVIAPRHVERAKDIARLVENAGYQPVFFSQCDDLSMEEKHVLVVDTIGQLRGLYTIAEIVVMGKTFCVGGGQNMIEPAYFAKPVIVGPQTQNFKDAVQIFKNGQAMIQVNDKKELLQKVQELLIDPRAGQEMGMRAKNLIKKYQGATLRTLEKIEKVIG